MAKNIFFSFLLFLSLFAISCDSSNEEQEYLNAANKQRVVDLLREKVIIGGYQKFSDKSLKLSESIRSFCLSVNDEKRSEAKKAWLDVQKSWKFLDVIQFGVVVEYPDRFGIQIDYWPIDEEKLLKILLEEREWIKDDMKNIPSSVRGLTAMEYLLFSQKYSNVSIIEDQSICLYLQAASDYVYQASENLLKSWQRETSVNFSKPEKMIELWVNQMAFSVENIRDVKLGIPLGRRNHGELDLKKMESPYSDRSIENITDQLAGIRNVWDEGIKSLCMDSPTLVESIDHLFDIAEFTLDKLPDSLRNTLLLEPEVIEGSRSSLRKLQLTLQTDLLTYLDARLAFSSDGD